MDQKINFNLFKWAIKRFPFLSISILFSVILTVSLFLFGRNNPTLIESILQASPLSLVLAWLVHWIITEHTPEEKEWMYYATLVSYLWEDND